MDLDEARRMVGRKVIYCPRAGRAERGTLNSVRDSGDGFVHFDAQPPDAHGQLCRLSDLFTVERALSLMLLKDEVSPLISNPTSVTHFICPEAPDGGTRHIIYVGSTVPFCRYCECSPAELRVRNGLS